MLSLRRYTETYLTPLSIGALLAGFLGAVVVYFARIPAPGLLLEAEVLAKYWVRLLALIALPLVGAYLILAVTSTRDAMTTGKAGGAAVLVHACFVAVAVGVGIAAVPIMRWFPPPLISAESAFGAGPIPTPGALDGGSASFVLRNPLDAVLSGDILSMLIWIVLVAVLLSVAPRRIRDGGARFAGKLSELGEKLVSIFLIALPPAVFVVAFAMTVRVGPEIAGTAGYYIIGVSTVLLLMVLFLYAVGWLVGRTPPKRLGRAAAPSQLLAVGTRSSIVCVPLVVEAARDELELPEPVVGVVVPLSGALFKLSKPAAHTFTVFFLASVFSVELGVVAVSVFLLGIAALSFGTPGIPSTATTADMPLYLALGIPLEGYLLVEVLDTLPDMVKTALNVTCYLTLAIIVCRIVGSDSGRS